MKDQLFTIFGVITAIFFLSMAVKSITKLKICALCMSISSTWLGLLILYWTERFNNPVILALLIGNSIVGIYYLLEKKVSERLHILKFPFFLSMVFVGYGLVKPEAWNSLPTILLLTGLWLLFGFLFAYQNTPKLTGLVKSIINCCKNW